NRACWGPRVAVHVAQLLDLLLFGPHVEIVEAFLPHRSGFRVGYPRIDVAARCLALFSSPRSLSQSGHRFLLLAPSLVTADRPVVVWRCRAECRRGSRPKSVGR